MPTIETDIMHAHTYVGASEEVPVGGIDGAYIIAWEPYVSKNPQVKTSFALVAQISLNYLLILY